jgi:hypothetical protein
MNQVVTQFKLNYGPKDKKSTKRIQPVGNDSTLKILYEKRPM